MGERGRMWELSLRLQNFVAVDPSAKIKTSLLLTPLQKVELFVGLVEKPFISQKVKV